jgi:hypothetical protein
MTKQRQRRHWPSKHADVDSTRHHDSEEGTRRVKYIVDSILEIRK